MSIPQSACKKDPLKIKPILHVSFVFVLAFVLALKYIPHFVLPFM